MKLGCGSKIEMDWGLWIACMIKDLKLEGVCVVDAASAKRVKKEVFFTLLICGESKKMNRYKSLEPYIGITK
jgi:hypothetical protein